jgi:hypothetical protein
MVFGPLSLLSAGPILEIDGLRIPLPRPAGLALEKLVSDRTGEKGDLDLLVVAGLLAQMTSTELEHLFRCCPPPGHRPAGMQGWLSMLSSK